jgi:hypothetical protein
VGSACSTAQRRVWPRFEDGVGSTSSIQPGRARSIEVGNESRSPANGTLDSDVTTSLPETEVEVLLLLEPQISKSGWPEGYFERTFGSLQNDPMMYEPPPPCEIREELR